MEFTLGKIYSWQEVSRHWQHMADGGEDGWLPPDHEDPPGRMPGSKVTEVKSWKPRHLRSQTALRL